MSHSVFNLLGEEENKLIDFGQLVETDYLWLGYAYFLKQCAEPHFKFKQQFLGFELECIFVETVEAIQLRGLDQFHRLVFPLLNVLERAGSGQLNDLISTSCTRGL